MSTIVTSNLFVPDMTEMPRIGYGSVMLPCDQNCTNKRGDCDEMIPKTLKNITTQIARARFGGKSREGKQPPRIRPWGDNRGEISPQEVTAWSTRVVVVIFGLQGLWNVFRCRYFINTITNKSGRLKDWDSTYLKISPAENSNSRYMYWTKSSQCTWLQGAGLKTTDILTAPNRT